MDPVIRHCLKPRVGLMIFKCYHDEYHWVQRNLPDIAAAGALWHKAQRKITFPNGVVLYLGSVETSQDLDKFLSLEYDFLVGTNDEMAIYRITNPYRGQLIIKRENMTLITDDEFGILGTRGKDSYPYYAIRLTAEQAKEVEGKTAGIYEIEGRQLFDVKTDKITGEKMLFVVFV
jgi:hypothetical protein